ncbi:hypothetical protein GCM10009850_013200 [Nonomuraea monospora]|uniref:Uncharacterized protein n=1 Tax=Nonomuraea monospora TaxID=568818 RepID=A0ABP5P215_9ACTN
MSDAKMRVSLRTPRPARFGKVGSILLSADFIIALPAGVAGGLLVSLSKAVAAQASTFLFGAAALLGTLAGIVIAAHTILISLMSPEYVLVLERAQGGVRAVSRPYKIVIWACAIGVLLALFAGLAWPAIPQVSELGWHLVRGVVFGAPTALGVYGLIGAAQLAGLSAFHLEQRAKLLHTLREARVGLGRDRKGA